MLSYDQPINPAKPEQRQAAGPAGFNVLELIRLLWARKVAILSAALLCACIAVAIGKSLTPKYTATAQLYVDPRELQLVERELTPRAQDVSGLAMVVDSEAAKERREPAGVFYYWKGERPRHPNAPQLEGTGEISLESADRGTGYWTTRSDRDPALNTRIAGVYHRADPADLTVLDEGSAEERAELIARRLEEWKAAANAF